MVTVIDQFVYPLPDRRPDFDINAALAKGYKDDISEVTRMVRFICIKYQTPITLTFSGDRQSGMQCTVSCDDEETKSAAITFINRFFREQ